MYESKSFWAYRLTSENRPLSFVRWKHSSGECNMVVGIIFPVYYINTANSWMASDRISSFSMFVHHLRPQVSILRCICLPRGVMCKINSHICIRRTRSLRVIRAVFFSTPENNPDDIGIFICWIFARPQPSRIETPY